ncbi:hypothetical protein B0H17DRAFT_1140836 [Mycena rosella]|uniref:Uncharacterized protein n=1 Tax=Mycena rosella TaxID=1033263 RepID=A0AAD7G7B3_MYCRO|nr:hypothetical protein B0H17DRAFT_1140836 [Mycena rosella]
MSSQHSPMPDKKTDRSIDTDVSNVVGVAIVYSTIENHTADDDPPPLEDPRDVSDSPPSLLQGVKPFSTASIDPKRFSALVQASGMRPDGMFLRVSADAPPQWLPRCCPGCPNIAGLDLGHGERVVKIVIPIYPLFLSRSPWPRSWTRDFLA